MDPAASYIAVPLEIYRAYLDSVGGRTEDRRVPTVSMATGGRRAPPARRLAGQSPPRKRRRRSATDDNEPETTTVSVVAPAPAYLGPRRRPPLQLPVLMTHVYRGHRYWAMLWYVSPRAATGPLQLRRQIQGSDGHQGHILAQYLPYGGLLPGGVAEVRRQFGAMMAKAAERHSVYDHLEPNDPYSDQTGPPDDARFHLSLYSLFESCGCFQNGWDEWHTEYQGERQPIGSFRLSSGGEGFVNPPYLDVLAHDLMAAMAQMSQLRHHGGQQMSQPPQDGQQMSQLHQSGQQMSQLPQDGQQMSQLHPGGQQVIPSSSSSSSSTAAAAAGDAAASHKRSRPARPSTGKAKKPAASAVKYLLGDPRQLLGVNDARRVLWFVTRLALGAYLNSDEPLRGPALAQVAHGYRLARILRKCKAPCYQCEFRPLAVMPPPETPRGLAPGTGAAIRTNGFFDVDAPRRCFVPIELAQQLFPEAVADFDQQRHPQRPDGSHSKSSGDSPPAVMRPAAPSSQPEGLS